MIALLLGSRVFWGVAVAFAIVTALALWKSGYDEDRRAEGRAEVQTKFDEYRNRVIRSTEIAQAKAIAASKAVHEIGGNVVIVYRDRITKLQSLESEKNNAFTNIADLPECRLDDGVRDALNAVRSGAARVIIDSYGAAGAVSPARAGGREPRESR